MSKNPNLKNCVICGKEYKYCATCEKFHGWKYYSDTHECYQVYEILQSLREGVITNKQAYDKFEYHNITIDYAKEHFLPSVARDIENIITENTKSVNITKNTKSK